MGSRKSRRHVSASSGTGLLLGEGDVPDAPPAEVPAEAEVPVESVDVAAAVAQVAEATPAPAPPPRAASPGSIVVVEAPQAPAPAPGPSAAAAASPASMKELRRELAESHAVAVRTANAVTTLAGSLKEVIQRQHRYDRGLNLNSFVAYVIFTALLGSGFYLLYRQRAEQLVGERDQALRSQRAAIDEVAAARAELDARDAAQRKALDYWTLLATGKREEAIAKHGEIVHERLTPVEKQVFEQGVARARAEIVDAGWTEGLEAYSGQQWKRATGAFKKALAFEADGPRAAQMRYYYGVALHKLGDYAESSRQLELALAGGAERSVGRDARWWLGGAFEQLRQFERARSEYDKFASGQPMHPWANAARRKSLYLAQQLNPPAPRPAAPAAPVPSAAPAPGGAPAPAPAAPAPAAPPAAPATP